MSLRRGLIRRASRRWSIPTRCRCARSKATAISAGRRHDIFLTEVLWGEPIGLLPIDDGLFTVYFAHLPLVGFDSKRGKLVRYTG